MRRAVLTVGLALSIACCLGVSASGTVDLAAAHHMSPWARPLLVGALELLSLGCAWGWVTSTDTWVKIEFAAVMAAASAVSIVGGVQAYDWAGVIAPLAMIAAVHVTSRMWLGSVAARHAGAAPRGERAASEPASQRTPDQPEPTPEPAEAAPAVVLPARLRYADLTAPEQLNDVTTSCSHHVDLGDEAEEERRDVVPAGASSNPRVTELARRLAAGEELTGAAAAAAVGCSVRNARRLLAAARELDATGDNGPRPALHVIGRRS